MLEITWLEYPESTTRRLEALVRAHGGAMFTWAMRLLGDADQAAAAVQSAFDTAFRTAGGPCASAGRAALLRWTTAAAIRGDGDEIADWLPAFTADGHWAAPRHRVRVGSPANSDRTGGSRLAAALRGIPAGHRAVVRLRDIEGLDAETTAALIDLPCGVVEQRLHRARMALCTLMRDERASA